MVEGICGTAREVFRTEQKIERECQFKISSIWDYGSSLSQGNSIL
jgi:hypothetical protein